MIIFQGPVPVAYNDQWLRISGYPDVLDSNACGSNDGAIIIKRHHHVLKLWIQTINDSEVSERKALLIFDGFTLHLKIDLLKGLGGYGMVVLLCMTNTSHKTNVEDLMTFGISKIEFQNSKQSLMTESLELGNTNSLKREDLSCILKQFLEKACTTVLNISGWAHSVVYSFYRAPVRRVRNIYIEASAAALTTSEPLTYPTKYSVPLTDLNSNAVDALTTAVATDLAHKHRRAEAISDSQVERVPGKDSETETE